VLQINPRSATLPSDTGTPSSPFLERKLATILSADVAEFSRLMSEDEEQTLRTFRGHKQVFESVVAMHNGRVFNTAGDAILAEFKSAVEAVRCATDIQTALRTRNDQLPPNRQVRFRIGVNLGDVLVQGQDLLGDGVNVAARLQTAAEPGGICISGSVHDQIRNKLSMTFQSLGERTYKNIAQPVRTFSVSEAENGAPLPAPKVPPGNKSIVAASIAAVAVLLLLGGGYWAYTRSAARPAPVAQEVASAPAAQPTAPTATAAKAEEPVPTPPAVQPVAAPTSIPKENTNAVPATKPTHPTPKASPAAPASASAASAAASTGPYDGVFEGPVCFEETLKEARRCFHGLGVIKGNEIKGQWPMGKDTGVTMFLQGEVSNEGDVKMEMHSEKSDGSRLITADFTGWIHDRLFDANGKLRMGRPATIHWHKSTQVP
jgi:class 3 adenylate cyclase